MKNMNTTLEIPEGSKATIQGKVIDGKNYLVVEVENEEQKEPEWTKFKKGDFVVLDERWISIYKGRGTSETCISDYCGCWINPEGYPSPGVHDGAYRSVDNSIRLATEEEKQDLLDMLAKKGLMWDAEKLELVKIPDVPEWKNFKRGDVLICPDAEKEIFVIFGEYVEGSNHTCFNCIFNSTGDANTNWASSPFRKTTKEEEGRFFKWLDEEKGLEWDGEKLVEFLKEGDMAIFWDYTSCEAIIAVYRGFLDGSYVDHLAMYWDNAIRWDGTREQYERVLRGEI